MVKGKHTTVNPFFEVNPFLTNLWGVGINSSETTLLARFPVFFVWKTFEVVDVHNSFDVDVG